MPMADYQTVTAGAWTKVPDLLRHTNYIFVAHQNTNASQAAIVNVHGRKFGDTSSVPLSLDVTITSDASKPSGSALYSGAVQMALQDADEIMVEQVSLAGGTATYVVGPASGPTTALSSRETSGCGGPWSRPCTRRSGKTRASPSSITGWLARRDRMSPRWRRPGGCSRSCTGCSPRTGRMFLIG